MTEFQSHQWYLQPICMCSTQHRGRSSRSRPHTLTSLNCPDILFAVGQSPLYSPGVIGMTGLNHASPENSAKQIGVSEHALFIIFEEMCAVDLLCTMNPTSTSICHESWHIANIQPKYIVKMLQNASPFSAMACTVAHAWQRWNRYLARTVDVLLCTVCTVNFQIFQSAIFTHDKLSNLWSPTILQPFTNHSPTILQPFSKHSPTILQAFDENSVLDLVAAQLALSVLSSDELGRHPWASRSDHLLIDDLKRQRVYRIHGAGIYANIKGVYWWDPCYHI